MATPAEVLTKAQGLVEGSRLERARAATSTLGAFLKLSAEDKRELAVNIAKRVAPDLVPRIEQETGMDLTEEQSRAVLDMIQRMDGNDLKELSASMSSPEGRRETAQSVMGAAAAATGLDDVVDEPAASVDVDGLSDAALAGRVAELEANLAAAQTESRTVAAARDAAQEDVQEQRAQVMELETKVRDVEDRIARLQREHDAEVGELQRQLRTAQREAGEGARDAQTGATMSTAAAAAGASTIGLAGADFDSPSAVLEAAGADGGAGLAPKARAVTAARLAQELEEMSASSALRHIRGQAPKLSTESTNDLAAILHAIPDGWARRRALVSLVESGAADTEDVSLLQLLEGVGNQVFAARSYLDAGVDFSAVSANLSPSARGRLTRGA